MNWNDTIQYVVLPLIGGVLAGIPFAYKVILPILRNNEKNENGK